MTEREVQMSRRDLLRYAAQGAVVLGAGSVLSAAASGAATASTAMRSEASTKIKRGGTLQAGLSGGSSSDTLDPQNWVNLVDGARVYCLVQPAGGLRPRRAIPC